MNKQIFVNLPVQDLNKSIEFFKSMGYTFNSQFCDETAACMVISDTIYVMLLTHPKFNSFTPLPVCDARKNTEVMICLSCESRAQVDELVAKAKAAGGGSHQEKADDHGFMYGNSFTDLDGHIWELMFMEPSHVQQ